VNARSDGLHQAAPTAGDAVPSRPQRLRRLRGAEVDVVVLDAAAEILRESGVAGCTIEAVNQRSGIGKPAIYRRWPHRTAMAIDAFARRIAIDVPITDTGDARADLIRAFVAITEQYAGSDGNVYSQLLAAAALEPGAAQLMRERFFTHRRDKLLAIWRQGRDRGQLGTHLDPEDGIDLIFGAGIFRLLVGHQPTGADDARRLAETVLDAAAPRPDTPSHKQIRSR
jgi:AcrR family transcriptional regulator